MAVLTEQVELDGGAEPAIAEHKARRADGSLGILAVFAVVWGLLNLVGLALALTQSPDSLARNFSPEQVAYILDTPVWVRICHAVSVVCLLAGAVYLLLRRASAYLWLMGSVFAMLGLMVDGMLRGGFELLASITTGLNLGYIIVGVFLFWAALSAKQDGQLSA